MRSTGLVQGFGSAGESASSMRKSPFTSSGTPARFELCWIFPSFAQRQRRKNAGVGVASTALPEPRRRPQPSSGIPRPAYVGCKVPDHPDLTSGCDASHRGIAESVGITPIPPLNLNEVLGQDRVLGLGRLGCEAGIEPATRGFSSP